MCVLTLGKITLVQNQVGQAMDKVDMCKHCGVMFYSKIVKLERKHQFHAEKHRFEDVLLENRDL